MKISVILPIYNQEKYLHNILDQIFKSPEKNLEIIAVNDGSTDSSLEILQEYLDDRLVFYSKLNEGLYKTWKYGLSKATGEYVMFIDTDDTIDYHIFTAVNKIIQDYGPSLIQFGYEIIKDGKKTYRNFNVPDGFYAGNDLQHLKDDLLLCPKYSGPDFPASRWSKVFKASEFKEFLKHSLDNARFFEDVCVTIPYAHVANSIYITHNSYYGYIIRKNSISQSKFNENDYIEYQNLISFFKNNAQKFGFSSVEINLMEAKYLMVLLSKCISFKDYKRCRKFLRDKTCRDIILNNKDLTGIKRFLIKHKMFKTFRVLSMIKQKL